MNNQELKQILLAQYAIPTDAKTVDFCRKCYDFLKEDEAESKNEVAEMAINAVMPDGVYLVMEDSEPVLFWDFAKGHKGKSNNLRANDGRCVGIGIKLGCKSLTVALYDASEDETALTANEDTTKGDVFYIGNYEDASADWEGQGNTKHLKRIGLSEAIHLTDEQWIPSLGELKFIQLFRKEINAALDYVRGEILDDWYWSSTEFSATNAWGLYLSDGYANYFAKATFQGRVRAVSAFLL